MRRIATALLLLCTFACDPEPAELASAPDKTNPHLSCIPPLESYDPRCSAGCLNAESFDGQDAYAWCGIMCGTVDDCWHPTSGEAQPVCSAGMCHLPCSEQIDCPADMACEDHDCVAPYSIEKECDETGDLPPG